MPDNQTMINTLYLPELREMLQEGNAEELREFCQALHPARTSEFMSGLTTEESWQVLRFAEPLSRRVEIFHYFDRDLQIDIITTQDRDEVAEVLAHAPPDDRVDILQDLDEEVVDDLLQRIPAEERRDILRLSQYPEGTAGAVMTTEVAKLSESLTVRDAFDDLARQSEDFETIYYLYIVDSDDQLRGLVSARQLVAAMRKPETRLSELMETDLVTVDTMEDQESVANKVARLDLLAIPVLDTERKMVGIITHDDIIDVVREEATEDAHRIAAVDPLDESYLRTSIFTLSWKRGMWLLILFGFALLTAVALDWYDQQLARLAWLVPFIPLVISSGGNTGSQSATLIITALTRGHITLNDWWQVVWRELLMGALLGSALALFGLIVVLFFPDVDGWAATFVLPITLLLVVITGTLTGSLLPLVFQKLGFDPALMSNPFVAGIIDIVGIVIYLNVAMALVDIS